ncbi:MAG: hypothetical protein AAGB34_02550 [Planctomycetota bacterium]
MSIPAVLPVEENTGAEVLQHSVFQGIIAEIRFCLSHLSAMSQIRLVEREDGSGDFSE